MNEHPQQPENVNHLQERILDSYRYLCNTDSVNKQLTAQDVEQVRSILKQIQTPANVNFDPAELNDNANGGLPKFTDRFKQRLKEKQQEQTIESEPNDESTPQLENEDVPEQEEDSKSEASETRSDTSSLHTIDSKRSQKSQRSHEHRKRRPETYEQRKMKKNFLIILRKLEQEGYHPTQHYTMDDPLQDVKEEVEQYYMCKEASSFVSKWKNNVEMGAGFLEMGSQFIPKQPLKLKGLQSAIKRTHDSKQVDIDWERIYYMYRRKKMSNPLWSLAIAYGLAAISTCVGNYVGKKLGLDESGNGGGGGLGGGLGGIVQSLLGGLMGGGNKKEQSMPSMVNELPTHTQPPNQPFRSPHQPQMNENELPRPVGRFQRRVFFPPN